MLQNHSLTHSCCNCNGLDETADGNTDANLAMQQLLSAPFKMVSKRVRMQFTCSFKDLPSSCWGRVDLKGVKTLVGEYFY